MDCRTAVALPPLPHSLLATTRSVPPPALLPPQAAAAQALGMRVLVGNICCCSTSARNSASLAAQIAAHTAPHDRVIILAHSHGTLAALDLLCNPAHAAVSQRVECFLPLNGVFGGTPMADLCTSSSLVSAVLEATWGRLLAVVGGGEAGVLRDMTAAARRAYHAQHGDRIAAVLRRVAVVALASHYRWPRWPPPRLLRVAAVEAAVGVALLPQRMVMDAMGWAPNDGCVPLASQVRAGAHACVHAASGVHTRSPEALLPTSARATRHAVTTHGWRFAVCSGLLSPLPSLLHYTVIPTSTCLPTRAAAAGRGLRGV